MNITKRLARKSDPSTSKEAAKSIAPHLKDKQQAVLSVLKEHPFGLSDHELVDICQKKFGWESGSTARTRRSELTDMGLVYDSGHRVKRRGHRASTVWRVKW